MLVGLWYFVEGVVHLDHVNIVGEGGGYGFVHYPIPIKCYPTSDYISWGGGNVPWDLMR